MRETESSLQQFSEFLLKRQLARQSAAPYFVRWVRQFLARPASDEAMADQVRHFCEDLERAGRHEEWPLGQVETTMIYTYVVKDLRTAPRSPLDRLLEERGARRP